MHLVHHISRRKNVDTSSCVCWIKKEAKQKCKSFNVKSNVGSTGTRQNQPTIPPPAPGVPGSGVRWSVFRSFCMLKENRKLCLCYHHMYCICHMYTCTCHGHLVLKGRRINVNATSACRTDVIRRNFTSSARWAPTDLL